jgi:hypothetical protein
VLEPAFEYFIGGASFDWAFGAERTLALIAFVGTGVLAYGAVLLAMSRKRPSGVP